MKDLKLFRAVALMEATSFLALLLATVVKHTGGTEVAVQVLGPAHGALFLLYVALALAIRREAGWNLIATVLVLLGAVLPLGGYAVDRWLLGVERTQHESTESRSAQN